MKTGKLTLLLLTGSMTASSLFAQENKIIMKNIKQVHDSTTTVSANLIFSGTENSTRALQIKKDGLLAEHTTKTEAMLICVSGEVIYEDEKKKRFTLKQGDYLLIVPMVKHWVKGIEDSQLLLIK